MFRQRMIVKYSDKSPHVFHCGSQIYSRAVVIDTDPLVCRSMDGDMTWSSTINEQHLEPIGWVDEAKWWWVKHRMILGAC